MVQRSEVYPISVMFAIVPGPISFLPHISCGMRKRAFVVTMTVPRDNPVRAESDEFMNAEVSVP